MVWVPQRTVHERSLKPKRTSAPAQPSLTVGRIRAKTRQHLVESDEGKCEVKTSLIERSGTREYVSGVWEPAAETSRDEKKIRPPSHMATADLVIFVILDLS